MNNMFEWIGGFLREDKPQSSKRLTMILSYLVALGLCIVSVVFAMPIESNVMTMLLGCCGVATTGYVTGSKKTEVVDDKQ